ncbi:hypothetical protein H7X65_00415, partial [Candidatus Parcubacteria bacterium]|nr:hypothetical protein [Candidatus Parcubacteria bacterium]
LTENASKLNPLHKHDLNVPTNWDDKVNGIKDTGLDKYIKQEGKAESVSDFLNKKFDNEKEHGDYLSKQRADRIEGKLGQTTAALKLAEAELAGRNQNSLYPNLKKPVETRAKDTTINPDFQSDYHPDLKTVRIGDSADNQGGGFERPRKKKSNFTFGFLIFMLIFFFFIGAGFYTYINLAQGTNTISTNKVDIKVTGPVNVKSGEVSDFIIDITNNNTSELILSDLVIQYPDGSKSPADRNQDLTNERISIGTIKPGQTIRQKNSIVFFGEQNVKKNIRYSYEFNINDSATIFKTDKDVGVFIAGSPINVVVNNVKEINNNQELTFNIDLSSNTEEVLKNIQLRVEYPFGYRLLEATPKPISDNNTWSFDSISPLSSTTIKLKGKFIGEVNVDKNFRFTLGIEDTKTKEMLTVLTTQDTQVAIRKPFVVTRLLIDGDSADMKAVTYDQNMKNDLVVTNNLPDAVTDVVVEVSLAGALIDRTSISSSDGFYDSNRDVIFWDKSLNTGLINIPPGESRELSFNMRTLSSSENLIKTLRRSSSDLVINVKAQRLSENRVPENIVASTKKQLRLQTDTVLYSNMAYDKGTYSPEVNKEVVYKYIGNISNTANTVKDVTFTAKLPPNATWKGVYGPNIPPASIKYNQSTRELTISLSDVEAGAGIDKPLREFYFKIGFIPTLTQSGQLPITIMNPTLTATDSFTGEKIQSKTNSMSTSVTTGQYSEVGGAVK